MSLRISVLALVALLSCLAVEASADEMIFLKSGGVFQGEILESDWESVKVKLKLEGGTEETFVLSVDECDPHFYYRVRDKALGNDAAGRIKLAKYAVLHDMFPRAKAQMDHARAIDEKVVDEFMENEYPRIKAGIADRVLKAARRSFQRGSMRNAKKYASLILTQFEDTPAEAEAEKLLDEIQEKIDADNAKKSASRRRRESAGAARDAAKAEQAAQARDKMLVSVEKLIAEASRINIRGLKTKNLSQARGLFDSAGKKFEQAIKKADQHLAGDVPDEMMTESLGELRSEAVQGGVQAYLNAARALSSRGTYQEAVAFTNRALALDPNNAQALSARATISTTTGGWGVRRGRR